MNRIEINVQTGEKKIIELTPAEVTDAMARTAAEALERAKPRPKTLEERVAAIEVKLGIQGI